MSRLLVVRARFFNATFCGISGGAAIGGYAENEFLEITIEPCSFRIEKAMRSVRINDEPSIPDESRGFFTRSIDRNRLVRITVNDESWYRDRRQVISEVGL